MHLEVHYFLYISISWIKIYLFIQCFNLSKTKTYTVLYLDFMHSDICQMCLFDYYLLSFFTKKKGITDLFLICSLWELNNWLRLLLQE